jgi:hypothetical protein
MRYKIEQGKEEINSTGGISLVGGILNKLNMFVNFEFERGGGHLTHDAHCKAMIALLCEGRSDFIDIETHKHDPVFKESLALEKVPSEPSFGQRLGEAAIYGAEKNSQRFSRIQVFLNSARISRVIEGI